MRDILATWWWLMHPLLTLGGVWVVLFGGGHLIRDAAADIRDIRNARRTKPTGEVGDDLARGTR